MKLKKVLGFGLAFVAMSMLTVAVQAATYTAKATVSADKTTVTVAVNLTDAETVNGYAVKLGYDPAVLSPVKQGADATGDDCYATSSITNDSSVLVADLIDTDSDNKNDTVAVGWAAADAVTVDKTNGTDVAVVTFEVVDQKSTDVTVEVVASAKDASTLESTTGAKGTVSFGILGDVDGDTKVTAGDASLVAQYAVGTIQLTEEQLSLADLDGDNFISAGDASLIAQLAVEYN
jgi:hypothetical protein